MMVSRTPLSSACSTWKIASKTSSRACSFARRQKIRVPSLGVETARPNRILARCCDTVRLVDDRGELVDAQFAFAECQNDAGPCGIRERREHLDGEFDARDHPEGGQNARRLH